MNICRNGPQELNEYKVENNKWFRIRLKAGGEMVLQ